ncbi:MAG: hypothetical protein HC915_06560 [Anaerolineae bacterium]|nr:hypothetical protein [Anaerolineae bacterium]
MLAVDTLLEAATARGIALQVALIWHQAFSQQEAPLIESAAPRPDALTDFDQHGYNAQNGGPLSAPEGIFTDARAEDLLRRRLHYSIARWGHSPAIAAWEVVTDLDQLPGYDTPEGQAWLSRTLNYVAEVDPYARLITVGSTQALPWVADHPAVNFVQAQVLGNLPLETPPDPVTSAVQAIYEARQVTDKPVLLSAFSLSRWVPPTEADPQGLHVRQTQWAALLAGSLGGGLSWWGPEYLLANDLLTSYAPFAQFVSRIPWSDVTLRPVLPAIIMDDASSYAPLRLDGFNRNFEAPPRFDTHYLITPDGSLPSLEGFSAFLYGNVGNPQASLPRSLTIHAPVSTVLTVAIRDVSSLGRAELVVYVDNLPYAALTLTGESDATRLTVPIPAGEHALVLDNLGDYWLELDYLQLDAYQTPLRALALADPMNGLALAWVQNRAYSWETPPTDLSAPHSGTLHLAGMLPGIYESNSGTQPPGKFWGKRPLSVPEDGLLRVPLLPLRRELALIARRTGGESIMAQRITPVPTRTPAVSLTPTPSPSLPASFTPTASPTVSATPPTAQQKLPPQRLRLRPR